MSEIELGAIAGAVREIFEQQEAGAFCGCPRSFPLVNNLCYRSLGS